MDNLDRDLERAETQANEYEASLSDSTVTTMARTTATDASIARHPTHRSRLEDQALRHTHTVGAEPARTRTEDNQPLPDFGGGKAYPPHVPADRDAYVVDFTGPDDPLHPMNWKMSKKLRNGVVGAVACFSAVFASSVLESAADDIARTFHVSPVVAAFTTVLFMLGYCVGPPIWAPMSELKGRRITLLISMFGFSIFSVGVGAAKDFQTITICRFFMGACGSSALVVLPASFTDIFTAEQRGNAIAVFVGCVMVSPCLGPIVGGFTVTSYLSWRMTAWWSTIMGFTATILLVFFFKETYPPTVLVTKAEYLRRRTKNWAIHAKQEEIEINIKELLEKNLTRPFRMLIDEPILLLSGIYLTFVYSMLYISLTAVPLVFMGVHHWKQGPASLPFIGIIIGICLSAGSIVLLNPGWNRKYRENGNRAVPEWRLPFAAFAGVMFALGLFWFGWTGAYKSVHWIVPTIGAGFMGYGIFGIFVMLNLYIIDAYLAFAASALAGNTIIRSLVAGSAPLFDRQMFVNMGIQWGMTLMGCFAVLLIPVPVIFGMYGSKIRSKSKWAPQLAAAAPQKEKELDESE